MILELITSLKTGQGEIFHPGKYDSKSPNGIPKQVMAEYNHLVKTKALEGSCIRVIELDPEPVVEEAEEGLDQSEKSEAGKNETNSLEDAAQGENDGPAPSETPEPEKKEVAKAKPKAKAKKTGLAVAKKKKK